MARILIGNIKGPQGRPGNDGGIGPVGPAGPPGPAGAVDNTTPIEFTEAAQRDNLVSGDSIATLFGKQKKWNADMINGLFPYVQTYTINYDANTKEEETNKVNNPLTVFGADKSKPYCILFNDTVGDSVFGSGTSCIYGYETSTQNYGIQFAMIDGAAGNKKALRIRTKNNGVWTDLFPVYNGLSGLTPADIGAASVGELTGVWKNWTWQSNIFASPGWFRIAQGSGSCTFSIKKGYHTAWTEVHKVEYIQTHTEDVFKSIYDKTYNNPNFFNIKKIRKVKVGDASYIDIYYDFDQSNGLTFLISDAVNDYGERYTIFGNPQIVPETATGETIMATLEFEANSWLGGSL